MKKVFIIVIILFWTAGISYAQKYSLLIADFVNPKGLSLDPLRLTYILREELSSYNAFSVISRSVTSQFLRYGDNGNGTSYTKKREGLIDHVSDVLLRKDVDFGVVAEIIQQNETYLLNISLLNYEGILIEDEIIVEQSEESVKDGLKAVLIHIFNQLNLAENENANPYEYDEMALIPGGNAVIGSFMGEPEEAPQRIVFVPAFYIDKYETTNAQYKKFTDAAPRKGPENTINPEYTIWKNGAYPEELANHPVVNVTWTEARAYCEWAGKRLPTAIEWEKAARGPHGNIYPWGNEFFPGYANLYVKGLSYVEQKTAPAGAYLKSKSFYGVFDLAGNAWEWTSSGSKGSSDLKKITKGGGWGYNGNKNSARASFGLNFPPDYTSNCLGFRCAK